MEENAKKDQAKQLAEQLLMDRSKKAVKVCLEQMDKAMDFG